MKLNPLSKHVSKIAAVALLTVSGAASAVTFNVSSTVQNALTVTNVADMNLGTLFATTASTGAYKFMTLSPDGTMGSPSGHASITLLGLGGQAAAQASVAVGTNTAFTVTLPDAEVGALNVDGVGSIGAIQGSGIDVEVAAADPVVARFKLVNFTVGNVTSGTADANCTNLDGSNTLCTLTPDFGATSVDFNIGATIVTDLDSGGTGDRDTYQAATYTGTFDVTATY